jgi:hypothetical protein
MGILRDSSSKRLLKKLPPHRQGERPPIACAARVDLTKVLDPRTSSRAYAPDRGYSRPYAANRPVREHSLLRDEDALFSVIDAASNCLCS